MARANLNKSVWLVTNTTTASKYIPMRTRISYNVSTFQIFVLNSTLIFQCVRSPVNKLKIVFCFQNCSDLLWENFFLVNKKTFEIRGWRLKICKIFEITIYIEQFIQTVKDQNVFLTYSWRFLRFIRTIRI